jgi:hypothetical protein
MEQQEQDALSAASQQQVKQGSADADTVLTEDFCLQWLNQNMPERDRGVISEQRLRKHIRLALAARGSSPWAAAVPCELWLNDVLPYRSVDEPLDEQDWRPMFYDKFLPMVSEASSLTEAAQILNRCAGVLGCCVVANSYQELCCHCCTSTAHPTGQFHILSMA